MTARLDRAAKVYDLLAEAPGGLTVDQMADSLGCGVGSIRGAIQALRDLLGDTDTINVVCEPDPHAPNDRWLFRLVGNVEGARAWATNRISDTERRIRTMYQVIASVTSGTSPNSKDGKKARLMKKALGRLIEDLDEVIVP